MAAYVLLVPPSVAFHEIARTNRAVLLFLVVLTGGVSYPWRGPRMRRDRDVSEPSRLALEKATT